MSILDPLTCGFAKVITFKYLTRNPSKNGNKVQTTCKKGNDLNKIYEELQTLFGTDYFKVSYTTFRNKYPSIVNHIHSIGKKNTKDKNIILDTFSESKWKSFTDEMKSKHKFENCDGCLKNKIFKNELAKFPIKMPFFRKKAEEAGLFKEKVLRDITQKTLNNLDQQFKNDYGTSFTTQIKKVIQTETPKLNKEDIIRSTKENIEQQWKETAVERLVFSFVVYLFIRLLLISVFMVSPELRITKSEKVINK